MPNLILVYIYLEERDFIEAEKLLRKAAEQGDAQAQHNLASLYCGGYGVTQDYSEAIKWYKKAAEQGVVASQEMLEKLK